MTLKIPTQTHKFKVAVHSRVFSIALLALLLTPLLQACINTAEQAPEPDLSRKVADGATGSLNGHIGEHTVFLDQAGNLPVEIRIVGNARTREFIDNAMNDVNKMYAQCQIPIETTVTQIPETSAISVNVQQRYQLTHQYSTRKPSIFIIESSAEKDVAFSYLPALQRDVSGTAWITNRVSDACFPWIVAHEIGHIVLNDGRHHPSKNNIMNARCSIGNNYNTTKQLPRWTESQCELMRSVPK